MWQSFSRNKEYTCGISSHAGPIPQLPLLTPPSSMNLDLNLHVVMCPKLLIYPNLTHGPLFRLAVPTPQHSFQTPLLSTNPDLINLHVVVCRTLQICPKFTLGPLFRLAVPTPQVPLQTPPSSINSDLFSLHVLILGQAIMHTWLEDGTMGNIRHKKLITCKALLAQNYSPDK